MVAPTIMAKLDQLPDSLQVEVLHYIEFLLDKYLRSLPLEQSVVEPGKQHGYGSWAGQIIMSDDFDQPLEDLQDYM